MITSLLLFSRKMQSVSSLKHLFGNSDKGSRAPFVLKTGSGEHSHSRLGSPVSLCEMIYNAALAYQNAAPPLKAMVLSSKNSVVKRCQADIYSREILEEIKTHNKKSTFQVHPI